MQGNWKRTAAIFLASQALSLFGSSLVQYALFWHVTLQTRSGTAMTLFVICAMLPTMLLSPFGGVLADRHDRRLLLALSDGMIAIATLMLGVVLYLGFDALWLMYVAAAIRAAGAAVQVPAVGAFLPQFVPTDQLTRINGINGTIQAVIGIAAPLASGALMSLSPLFVLFFVDVSTAALAIGVLLLFVRVPTHARAAATVASGCLEDLRTGLRYVRKSPFLMALFTYLTAMLVFLAPVAFLSPLQVARSYGPEVWRLTVIEVAFSGGMIVGGILVTTLPGFRNRYHSILGSHFVFALSMLLMGVVHNFPVYLASMFICGLALPYFNTHTMVVVQERVEESYLGRVVGIYGTLMSSVLPLGMLLYGPLAECFSIEWLMGVSAVALFAVLPFAWANRTLSAAGHGK